MDTNFLFDEFFANSSVYTVDFVMPYDHSDILVDIIQLSASFTSLVLVQDDSVFNSCITFVSAYSFGEFHTKLFNLVNKIRSLHNLKYKQFHYE